jgi:alpha-tubulin suppressor-like RCC1 family protein
MAANQVKCFRLFCQKAIYQSFLTCNGGSDFVGNPDSALGLVTALELSQHHYCSIDLEGHIQCGLLDLDQSSTTYPQARVPDDVDIVVDMALGEFFTCVVQNDFTVRCWGEESQYGQEFVLDTPQGGYYRAIAATDNEVCAITLDDFVHCWGRPFSNALYVPEEVSFVTELTAGSGHFCALMENQEVLCWGSNRFRELSPEYYG